MLYLRQLHNNALRYITNYYLMQFGVNQFLYIWFFLSFFFPFYRSLRQRWFPQWPAAGIQFRQTSRRTRAQFEKTGKSIYIYIYMYVSCIDIQFNTKNNREDRITFSSNYLPTLPKRTCDAAVILSFNT